MVAGCKTGRWIPFRREVQRDQWRDIEFRRKIFVKIDAVKMDYIGRLAFDDADNGVADEIMDNSSRAKIIQRTFWNCDAQKLSWNPRVTVGNRDRFMAGTNE